MLTNWMRRFFLVLIAFLFLGVLGLGALSMRSGPIQDQARSFHEIGRQESGLAK